VFERSLGHLALNDPARSLGRKISLKIQQACPLLWDNITPFAALCGVRPNTEARMAVNPTSVK
jgi:hypothetical protein